MTRQGTIGGLVLSLLALSACGGGGSGGDAGTGGASSAATCFNSSLWRAGTRIVMTMENSYESPYGNGTETISTTEDVLGTTTFNGQTSVEVRREEVYEGYTNLYRVYYDVDTSIPSFSQLGDVEAFDSGASYTYSYEPGLLFRFNLSPGGTYSQQTTEIERFERPGESPETETSSHDRTVTYRGLTTITVPAGTFDTCEYEVLNEYDEGSETGTLYFDVKSGLVVLAEWTEEDGADIYIDRDELISASINGTAIQDSSDSSGSDLGDSQSGSNDSGNSGPGAGGSDGSGGTDTNQAPIADAGQDVEASVGERVQLDGSGSSDSDGRIEQYRWRQKSGTAVVLIDDDTATPEFDVPAPQNGDTLRFELQVTDDDGATGTDEVVVTVGNAPPIADAGPDIQVPEGTEVTLDGSSSTDPDGSIEDFVWEQTGGPSVQLAGAFTPNPRFTAPAVDASASLEFRLTVTDDRGDQATDLVAVEVVFSPSTVANLSLSGDPIDVDIIGETMLVTSQGEGLYVVDISDRSAPSLVGELAMPDVREVITRGSIAYLSTDHGLVLIDISSPSNPAIHRTISLGQVSELHFSGDWGFLATGTGFYVLDMTDPENPVVLAEEEDSPGEARLPRGVVSGSQGQFHVYLADGEAGVAIYTIVPGDPYFFYIENTDSFGAAQYLAIDDEREILYVATRTSGLVVFDIEFVPSTAPAIGQLVAEEIGPTYDVDVDGNMAFLASGTPSFGAVSFIDVSDPSDPKLVGQVTTDIAVWKVEHDEDYVYAVVRNEGVRIISRR